MTTLPDVLAVDNFGVGDGFGDKVGDTNDKTIVSPSFSVCVTKVWTCESLSTSPLTTSDVVRTLCVVSPIRRTPNNKAKKFGFSCGLLAYSSFALSASSKNNLNAPAPFFTISGDSRSQ